MADASKRLLFILNPHAGRYKTKFELYELIEQLCRDFDPTIHMTIGPGDAADTAWRLGSQFDLVAACGGDGTLSEVINGVMRLPAQDRPRVGYVPAGTTNDFAASLNLPREMKKAAHVLAGGKTMRYDIGRLNETHYFSYVASFGAFSSTAYATAQTLKNALGHLGYLLEGIRSIGEIRPIAMTVRAEAFSMQDAFIFGAVMNSRQVAGLVQISADQVRCDDGLHEVMLIRSPKNLQELSGILTGLATQNYAHDCIRFFHTPHIVFESEAPVAWGTDGEYALTDTQVRFCNCRGAVELIAAEDAQ
jgi:diacylglycerol kinase (ATP)